MLAEAWFDRSIFDEVSLRLAQAEEIIWTASYLIGIVFILTIVMPVADWTNLVASASVECLEFAARASVVRQWLRRRMDILERIV